VYFAFGCFAERDYSGIQANHQCAQRQQAQRAFARNVESLQPTRYQKWRILLRRIFEQQNFNPAIFSASGLGIV
jgi:hypothetical protein